MSSFFRQYRARAQEINPPSESNISGASGGAASSTSATPWAAAAGPGNNKQNSPTKITATTAKNNSNNNDNNNKNDKSPVKTADTKISGGGGGGGGGAGELKKQEQNSANNEDQNSNHRGNNNASPTWSEASLGSGFALDAINKGKFQRSVVLIQSVWRGHRERSNVRANLGFVSTSSANRRKQLQLQQQQVRKSPAAAAAAQSSPQKNSTSRLVAVGYNNEDDDDRELNDRQQPPHPIAIGRPPPPANHSHRKMSGVEDEYDESGDNVILRGEDAPPEKDGSNTAWADLMQEWDDMDGANQERIQVFLRVRPFLSGEDTQQKAVNVLEPTEGVVSKDIQILRGRQLFEGHFDGVFNSDMSQAQVYEKVRVSVLSVLRGVNSAIFAYGQTGTGKTYTMLGKNRAVATPDQAILAANANNPATALDPTLTFKQDELYGITPRAMHEVFHHVKKGEGKIKFTVSCSYLEIYNERIFDLLRLGTMRGNDPGLELKTARTGEVFVAGLTKVRVHNLEEVLALLRTGDRHRAIRATDVNDRSNRSHTILQVEVIAAPDTSSSSTPSPQQQRSSRLGTSSNNGNQQALASLQRRATLSLVDLAGSERWKTAAASIFSGADAVNVSNSYQRQMDALGHQSEMTAINQSLHTLGRVISALGNPTRAHIPYRESKLTRLLQDSLGGNCRTTFVATLSPCVASVDETLSTLKFADCARQVLSHAVINEQLPEDEVRAQRVHYEREINRLKDQLSRANRAETEQLRSKIQALESRRDAYELEIRRLRDLLQQKAAREPLLRQRLQEFKEENTNLKSELMQKEQELEQERIAREKLRNAIRMVLSKHQQQQQQQQQVNENGPEVFSLDELADEEEQGDGFAGEDEDELDDPTRGLLGIRRSQQIQQVYGGGAAPAAAAKAVKGSAKKKKKTGGGTTSTPAAAKSGKSASARGVPVTPPGRPTARAAAASQIRSGAVSARELRPNASVAAVSAYGGDLAKNNNNSYLSDLSPPPEGVAGGSGAAWAKYQRQRAKGTTSAMSGGVNGSNSSRNSALAAAAAVGGGGGGLRGSLSARSASEGAKMERDAAIAMAMQQYGISAAGIDDWEDSSNNSPVAQQQPTNGRISVNDSPDAVAAIVARGTQGNFKNPVTPPRRSNKAPRVSRSPAASLPTERWAEPAAGVNNSNVPLVRRSLQQQGGGGGGGGASAGEFDKGLEKLMAAMIASGKNDEALQIAAIIRSRQNQAGKGGIPPPPSVTATATAPTAAPAGGGGVGVVRNRAMPPPAPPAVQSKLQQQQQQPPQQVAPSLPPAPSFMSAQQQQLHQLMQQRLYEDSARNLLHQQQQQQQQQQQLPPTSLPTHNNVNVRGSIEASSQPPQASKVVNANVTNNNHNNNIPANNNNNNSNHSTAERDRLLAEARKEKESLLLELRAGGDINIIRKKLDDLKTRVALIS